MHFCASSRGVTCPSVAILTGPVKLQERGLRAEVPTWPTSPQIDTALPWGDETFELRLGSMEGWSGRGFCAEGRSARGGVAAIRIWRVLGVGGVPGRGRRGARPLCAAAVTHRSERVEPVLGHGGVGDDGQRRGIDTRAADRSPRHLLRPAPADRTARIATIARRDDSPIIDSRRRARSARSLWSGAANCTMFRIGDRRFLFIVACSLRYDLRRRRTDLCFRWFNFFIRNCKLSQEKLSYELFSEELPTYLPTYRFFVFVAFEQMYFVLQYLGKNF